MNQAICTPELAASQIANLARQTGILRLEVREEKCFAPEKWLDLGTIQFDLPLEEDTEKFPLSEAIRNGQFLWATPTEEELRESLALSILQLSQQKDKAFKIVREGLQDITRRLGLLQPCFDVDTMREWPLTRHATWVMDVSALLQGCADFACHFLFPFVRLVIPPVANLEIQDMCDRFLARWRKTKETEAAYVELLALHLNSQAAQRTLLRLEWQYKAQVERVAIGNDRLRNVFEQDNKSEFKTLSLTSIQRSFADRLIFETAKEHRSHLGQGPSVRIATSDGGMARMALSEGMKPVFFHARRGSEPLGRLLSGTLPHPFKPEIYTVSLVEMLWELASCFGSARLRVEEGVGEFCALGMSSMEWSPSQVVENLFVCRWVLPEPKPTFDETSISTNSEERTVIEDETPDHIAIQKPSVTQRMSRFNISTKKFFVLVQMVADASIVSQKEMQERTQSKASSLDEFRMFLLSGELIEYENSNWKSTPALETLIDGYSSGNRSKLWQSLERVPSLRSFIEYAQHDGRRPDWREVLPSQRGVSAYLDLAEVCGLVLAIPESGLCATLARPTAEEFAPLALKHYAQLRRGSELVESGAWLEALAWHEGIAPVVSRELLEEAHKAGLLERFFEGSTLDTQFDDHNVKVLEITEGVPTVRRYYIYRGDFLWSERSSVRLSLVEVTK